jgi:predicted phage tail protein
MIRDIYLHGAVGRAHGRHFRLDVASPAEAVRALIMLRPPLRTALREGFWRVIVGTPHIANAVPLDFIGMRLGNQPMHLVPATPPAGGDDGKSIGTIIVGVALIGAAMVFAPIAAAGFGAAMATTAFMGVTYGSIALMGVSLVASGIAGLLTSPPPQQAQATDMARPDDRPSFLFNGVTNNTQQGGPVPLLFGRHLVGSVVVSGGLNSEDIAP